MFLYASSIEGYLVGPLKASQKTKVGQFFTESIRHHFKCTVSKGFQYVTKKNWSSNGENKMSKLCFN